MIGRFVRYLFAAGLPFLGVPALAPAQAPGLIQVLIIANPNIKGAEFSTSDLRDVFTGASSSLKGIAPIGPVLLKESSTHQEFLTLYIGKSDSAFRATWRSLIFSGQGTMPRTLDSETAVVEYVAHTPGAIGYINRATPHDGVKTLAIR